MANQGLLRSTRMCLSGRRQGSSSSSPAGTSKVLARRLGRGEPQRAQNAAVYAGGRSRMGASKVRIRPLPATQRKSSSRTPSPATKAEPDAFRQRLQWHSSKGPAARSISNCTSPQRQLPRIMRTPAGPSNRPRVQLPPRPRSRTERPWLRPEPTTRRERPGSGRQLQRLVLQRPLNRRFRALRGFGRSSARAGWVSRYGEAPPPRRRWWDCSRESETGLPS